MQVQGRRSCRRHAQKRVKDLNSKSLQSVLTKGESALATSSKRDRSSSSSSTAEGTAKGTGCTPTGLKIPRVKTDATPPATVSLFDEDEVVAGPVSEDAITMESLQTAFEDVSYAGVAIGQGASTVEKKDYPFLLYVHAGKEEREAITRDTWKTLLHKIADQCIALDLEGKGLDSDFSAFSKGAGIIATKDEQSREGMKKLISEIEVAGSSFRAWAKGEKGALTYFQSRLPTVLKKQPGERIVATLVKKHGLEDEDIKLISCHTAKGNPQRILKVGVKGDALEYLEGQGGCLRIASSALTFVSL